jgi:hypothetical protein
MASPGMERRAVPVGDASWLAATAALVALAGLLVCLALIDTPGYLNGGPAGARAGAPRGDFTHYVAWTRLVTLEGLEHAYRGTYPETFAVYGPVVMASYRAAGLAYRGAVDPAFELAPAQASPWLHRAIKSVALGWHVAAGLALGWLVWRRDGRAWGAAMAAFYLANPAAVFDVGHWGQPDGALALFAVLAVGWAAAGRWGLAGAALALAALVKPQAWTLLPLIGLVAWRAGGRRAVGLAAAGGLAAAAPVLAPYALAGRLDDLLTLPGVVARAMPVVSGNAHNLWWLVVGVQGSSPVTVADTAPLLGPLSYRAVAATLLVAFLALTTWLVASRRVGLAEGAALWVLGWFALTTQAHENHWFIALPLLCLALPRRPGLLAAAGLLSLTGLLNLALQDPLVLGALNLDGDAPGAQGALATSRTLNAVAGVGLLAGWTVAAVRRRGEPGRAPGRPAAAPSAGGRVGEGAQVVDQVPAIGDAELVLEGRHGRTGHAVGEPVEELAVRVPGGHVHPEVRRWRT